MLKYARLFAALIGVADHSGDSRRHCLGREIPNEQRKHSSGGFGGCNMSVLQATLPWHLP